MNKQNNKSEIEEGNKGFLIGILFCLLIESCFYLAYIVGDLPW